MSLVVSVQYFIGVALSLAALIVEAWALVSALRSPAAAFGVVGRLSKRVWVVILLVAVAFTVFSFGSPTGLISLIGAAAAIIFLVDTRVKLRDVVPDRPAREDPYAGW